MTYGKSRTSIANTLDGKRAEALRQYGGTLASVMEELKKKGDLDAFLAVQVEYKRFEKENKVPESTDGPASLAEAVIEYEKKIKSFALDEDTQTAKLLRHYIEALDGLIKKAMIAENIDEAKAVKEEKDNAMLVLNDLEAKWGDALQATPDEKSATPAETKPGESIIDQKTAAKKEARAKGKSFQMHRYLLVEEPQTWKEARGACENLGGHLVIIGNRSENDLVREMAGGKSVWIGLSDEGREGRFVWTDGSVVRYSDWARWQPDNLRGMEHYVALRQQYDSYGWSDEDGQQKNAYLCEWDY